MTTSRISRLNIFGALLIAETYSIYSSFIAQSLKPTSVSVLDRTTHKALPAGHIGDLTAAIDWRGFVATIAVSVVVFALAWSILSVTSRRRWLMTADESASPTLAQEESAMQGEAATAGV